VEQFDEDLLAVSFRPLVADITGETFAPN